MIGSISSATTMFPLQTGNQSNSNNSLNEDQLEVISSTLAQFDSNNLTASDAQTITEAFKEAGIKPSQALASAMETEGFDAKEVGDLSNAGPKNGMEGMMPPPPPPSKQEESDVSTLIDSLLNIQEDENDLENGSFGDIMEYTSRILNLNDSSKTKVMEMLENYSSDNNGFSQSEISNIVKNSLGQILSEPDNYNRVSFYA